MSGIEIEPYMQQLVAACRAQFGSRLLYIGLQGSCRRGEADAHSDIDIMTVLDVLHIPDMDTYKRILSGLDYANRSCGFICGKAELANWNPCELCLLTHETKDYYGVLSALTPDYTREDVRTYIKAGTGDLYHALCHGYIHSSQGLDAKSLQALYKPVFFILQNKHYLETGDYILRKAELLPHLTGIDREILLTAVQIKQKPPQDTEQAYTQLFHWCRHVLQTI